jgi:O-methyltransferase
MTTELEERIEGTSERLQGIEVVMSLCTKERLQVIATSANACRELPGEFWEMGVYLGGSAGLIGKIGYNKVLRLFDSFEGVSEPTEKDTPEKCLTPDGPMWAGEWRGDMKRALINIGRECIIHKGWIPKTFEDVPEDAKCAFAHVDCDLYEPTKASLEFILPRLSEGGLIVVDDFDFWRHPGIRLAIEELLPVWPKLKGRVEVPTQVVLYLQKNAT